MTDSVERQWDRGHERVRCARCGMSAARAPDGVMRCEGPPGWCERHPMPGRTHIVSSAIPASQWTVREDEVERLAIQEAD